VSSKQDYVKVAAAVHRLAMREVPVIFVMELIVDLCDTFAEDNKRFDRERFIAACLRGPGAEYRKEERP
jgi:hypothetical protein